MMTTVDADMDQYTDRAATITGWDCTKVCEGDELLLVANINYLCKIGSTCACDLYDDR